MVAREGVVSLRLARRADGGLRLSGLVDFGNARAADSLFDLAKALFCSAHEDARSHQPLLEGYGPIDHPEPERAMWLYTLFHRVSMWCWLTKLGDKASPDDGAGGLLRNLGQMALIQIRSTRGTEPAPRTGLGRFSADDRFPPNSNRVTTQSAISRNLSRFITRLARTGSDLDFQRVIPKVVAGARNHRDRHSLIVTI
jgi:hypothetical protein